MFCAMGISVMCFRAVAGPPEKGWQEIGIPFLGVVPVEVTFKEIIEGRFVKDDVMK